MVLTTIIKVVGAHHYQVFWISFLFVAGVLIEKLLKSTLLRADALLFSPSVGDASRTVLKFSLALPVTLRPQIGLVTVQSLVYHSLLIVDLEPAYIVAQNSPILTSVISPTDWMSIEARTNICTRN